jgi:hypothetical protein
MLGGCIEVPVNTGSNDAANNNSTSNNSASSASSSSATTSGAAAPATPLKAESSAASLRQGLDSLLQEHVMLMAQATDAALSGRNDAFNAAANHIEDNSRELEGAVRTVYGDDAGLQFYNLWHTHIGYVVDYALAVQANDEGKKTTAVNNMLASAAEMGKLLDTLTDGRMNHDMVADLIRTHLSGVKGVIDAQAAKDYAVAYTTERDTEKQSFIIGNTWTNAIVDQFPDKY